MIKKYSLVVIAFLCFVLSGFGQATLPLTRTIWNSTPTGWTDTPLDSYTSTFACSGSNGAKFDTTGDLKIVFFDSAPNQLSFDVKSNATTTSNLLVEESANGTTYTTVVSLTNTVDLPTTCTTKGPYSLNSASRYVRWTFTKGSQNMTMDDVSITKAAVTSDPNLTISGTTNHGSAVCVTTSASPISYTITNNSTTIPAAGITVSSNDSQFVVSGLSLTTIPPGGTATYNVTFTPSSAGAKSATITVNATLTPTSNSPTSSLTGTGVAAVTQAVTSAAATLITGTTATLNGNVTTLGTCPNTIEKGFVWSASVTNSDPLVLGTGVTKTAVTGVSTGNYNLPLTGLANGTQYSFKAYVFNGTTYTYGNVLTFTTTSPPVNNTCISAATLTVGAATISGTLTGANPTPGLAQENTKNDVWYSFTPTCSGSHTIVTTFASGPDLDLYVYTANCPASGNATFTSITGNATDETFTGNFNAGVTYYVRVLDFYNDASTFNIRVFATTPVITTQPANQTASIPTAATFNVASSTPGATFQWQVSTDGGAIWNNVTDGTGGTTTSYTTIATTETMNGYRYRCVVTNACVSVNSTARILTVNNSAPNNPTSFIGCFEDESVNLTWLTPASGTTPDGYVVFAIVGPTLPTGTKGDANTYTANSNFSAATIVTPSTLGKVVYKGTGNSITITGLVEDTNYSLALFAYKGNTLTAWSSGSAASRITNSIAQDDVSNLMASPNTNQVNLTWNNPLPTSCFNELIIVANQGSSVTFNPTGTYAPINDSYTTPNLVVYATTSTVSSKAITGLVNDVNACFKVYTRRGAVWSDGVEICATPTLTYCASSGNTSFATGIDGVILNTINNTGTSTTNAYTDYTSISTSLALGEVYDLSVKVNVDGSNTVHTRVWIDWNRNGSFNDSGEIYELGTIYNPSSSTNLLGFTSESPFSFQVPSNASIGATRMRVSSKWSATSTSCETGFSGEVEDYTINVSRPTGPEINIKGNNITILNGFDEPYGLNNTQFGPQGLSTTSAFKEFVVESLGLQALDLTGAPSPILLGGDNPGDFIITQQATTPVSAAGGTTTFRIAFRPTVAGLRTALVTIPNNDVTGLEDPYTFLIEGTGVCSTPPSVTALPNSGPANTVITFTPSGSTVFTGAETAYYNGMSVPITFVSPNIEAKVPLGAASGNMVLQLANGCSFTHPFTIIDFAVGSCDPGASTVFATQLTIYEIYDEKVGSGGYISIFNGTNASVNLSGYNIRRAPTYGGTYSTYANLTGTLASGALAIIGVSGAYCPYTTTGNGSIGVGGFNANDGFQLRSGTTLIDHVRAPNYVGYYMKRKTEFVLTPSTTHVDNEWTIQPVNTVAGNSECLPGFGVPPVQRTPPRVTMQPLPPNLDCDLKATLTIAGAEGVVGGNYGLAYQWFYNAPNTNTWVAILNTDTNYTGQQSPTLDILNTLNLNKYQYYCQVREDSVTCFKATNAVTLKVLKSVWNGTAWLPGAPNNNTIASIEGDYNTGIGTGGQTSFTACQLIVNPTRTLTVANNTYVDIQNNVANNGTIEVETKGAFVQRNDGAAAGIFDNNGVANVNKTTASFSDDGFNIHYTYWSAPTNIPSTPGFGQNIVTLFPNAKGNRRFFFEASNFVDSKAESSNGNQEVAGQDDIDDDSNDWQRTTGAMEIGRGYAVAATNPPGFPYNNSVVFSGRFNTGDITVNIYKNDSEVEDNNWNFIGNPYPSAISVNKFFDANVGNFPATQPVNPAEGAIFLWSQSTPPSDTNNGNQIINYSQSDYAIINRATETAGASTIKPNRYIPSGQGFFIAFKENLTVAVPSQITTGQIVFTNSMREISNNDQFFRSSNTMSDDTAESRNATREPQIVWLNLTSNNGVFNQIAIAYVNEATDGYDGWSYDTPYNLSSTSASLVYSIISEKPENKFAIQGKNPNSLNLDEIIPLGFYTSITQPTNYRLSIADLQGEFFTNNIIYLKDKLSNIIFNLSDSDYLFSSSKGEFNNRFEIVFKDQSLSVIENEITPNGLSIIELPNGQVKFLVGNNLNIQNVEIIDMLGRTLYNLKGNSPSEVYELSNLSQAAYMAKVTLSNGQVITKRAVKRK